MNKEQNIKFALALAVIKYKYTKPEITQEEMVNQLAQQFSERPLPMEMTTTATTSETTVSDSTTEIPFVQTPNETTQQLEITVTEKIQTEVNIVENEQTILTSLVSEMKEYNKSNSEKCHSTNINRNEELTYLQKALELKTLLSNSKGKEAFYTNELLKYLHQCISFLEFAIIDHRLKTIKDHLYSEACIQYILYALRINGPIQYDANRYCEQFTINCLTALCQSVSDSTKKDKRCDIEYILFNLADDLQLRLLILSFCTNKILDLCRILSDGNGYLKHAQHIENCYFSFHLIEKILDQKILDIHDSSYAPWLNQFDEIFGLSNLFQLPTMITHYILQLGNYMASDSQSSQP